MEDHSQRYGQVDFTLNKYLNVKNVCLLRVTLLRDTQLFKVSCSTPATHINKTNRANFSLKK